MAARWVIVGGGDKGGILVREGEGLKSPQSAERLSTGALVEQLKLVGERLHYRLLTGSGPKEGWISLKISGKTLAEPAPPEEEAAPAASAATFIPPELPESLRSAIPESKPFPIPSGRGFGPGGKTKMLYMYGGCINEKIGRMQITNTFKEIAEKKQLDWTVWNPAHFKVPLGHNGDMSLKMFGPDFYCVYERLPYANSQFEEWQGFEKTLSEFKKFIKANGPFDGVMGFDMGGEFLAQVAKLAAEGDRDLKECFRFMILFTSTAPKHLSPMGKARIKEPLQIPACLSWANTDENHPFMEYEELPLMFHKDFRECIVHGDGHRPPSLKKDQEVYARFSRFLDAMINGKPFTPSNHDDNAIRANLFLPIIRVPAPDLPEKALKRVVVVTDPMGAEPGLKERLQFMKDLKKKGEWVEFDSIPFEKMGPPKFQIETLELLIDVCNVTHEPFQKAAKDLMVEGVTYTDEQKKFNWHIKHEEVPSPQVKAKDLIQDETYDALAKEWAKELMASFVKDDEEEVALVGIGTGAFIALAIARMFVEEKSYVPMGLWVVCPPLRLPWATTAVPGFLGACPVHVLVSEYSTYGPSWRYEVSTLGPFKTSVYDDVDEMVDNVINAIKSR